MVTLVADEGESIEDLRCRLVAALIEVMEGADPISELGERSIEFSVTRRRMPRWIPVDI